MKNHFKILIAILIFCCYGCSNDEASLPETEIPMPEDTSLTTEEIVDIITQGDSDGVWKISSAKLTNEGLNDVDITSLYNVKDDEFHFNALNDQTINLAYKRGFKLDSLGSSLEELKSDINVSTLQMTLATVISNEETVFNLEDTYTFSYNQTDMNIVGTINYTDNYKLDLVLTEKLSSDYLQEPSELINPVELLQFETGVFRVGFKASQADNSLFITNRNDLEIFGQLAYKIDLDENNFNEISFNQQDFATKNIEFMNDNIVSLGGNIFEVFDYNFSSVLSTEEIDNNAIVSNGSAALDNEVYLFGGIVNGSPDLLATWSPGQTTYNNQATLPFQLNDIDGEIVDQKLYMFGGWESTSSTIPGSDKVYIYDLNLNSFSEMILPVNLYETYTSTVENLIYVGGLKSEDVDGDGDFERVPYLGVYNTFTSNFQQIDLTVGNLLDGKRLVHLQVAGDKAYFIASEDLGAPDGFVLRVYSAELN